MSFQLKHPVLIDSVRAELVGPTELRLEGSLIGQAAQTELARCLTELHKRMVAENRPSLTLDVRALTFVNSSALRVFVDLTSRAKCANYKLIFDIDDSIAWHRLTFSVLQSLGPQCVQVRSNDAAAARP
jgi:anti-anti-sigma regulatory factor